MFIISAIDGLTLPGMIDDPGCTGGSTISAIAVRGPDASRRRSDAMREISTAALRSALERCAMSAPDCVRRKKLSARRSSNPVSRRR
jgi:hypothetical protein